MGITLWIVPSHDDAKRLEHLMKRPEGTKTLSESSYPKFCPHITLAALPTPSTISTDEICSAVSSAVKPFSVEFENVTAGQHYFRSVYLEIKPTLALTRVHHQVHEKLSLEPRTPSYPHLSLCYIDDKDAAAGERSDFLNNLTSNKTRRDEKGQFYINCGDNDFQDWMSGFECSEIWAVECTGPVETWEVLKKINLS